LSQGKAEDFDAALVDFETSLLDLKMHDNVYYVK